MKAWLKPGLKLSWLSRSGPSALAMLGALLAAGWLILPLARRIDAQRSDAAVLRRSIEETRIIQAELDGRRDAYQALSRRSAELEERLGKGQALARVLDTLRTEAGRCHVELSATQLADGQGEPLPAIPLAPDLQLQEVAVRISLVGRFRQIGEFLGALGEAPFLSDVRGLTVTRKGERGVQLDAQLELVVYLAT